MAKELLDHESESGTVYGDSGYSSVEFFNYLNDHGHDEAIKPRPLTMAVPDGYSVDDFTVTEATNDTPGRVTCRVGHTVTISAKGRASFTKYCGTCALRHRCTRSK